MIHPEKIFKGIRNPRMGLMEVNRQFSQRALYRLRSPTNVFSRDWDNLIILDACRYDILSGYDFPGGRLETYWSGGSHSKEFLQYTLGNDVRGDTVWVTANPFVSRFADSLFRVVDVWDDGWDDDLNTVLPETVCDAAVVAERDHPDKRLVVQFMQPHYPFIGKTGRKRLPEHRSFTGGGLRSNEQDSEDIWTQLRKGRVSKELVWRAYRENLDVALPDVRRLVDELDGKTALTSDHGNAFGERALPVPLPIFGHPPGIRIESLVKVPWIQFDAQSRKTIKSGTVETGQADDAHVEKRLNQLGYLDT